MSNVIKILKFFGVAFLFVAVLGLAAYADQNPATRQKPTVSFSATSRMYVEPDLAVIIFSVINEAKTAPKAMEENARKMNAVIKSVKNLGVEGKDLKTTNFRISLRYEWLDNNRKKRVLVGYQVQQSLQVKIRNFKKIGEILQDAIDAGANEVGGLNFMVEKQEEIRRQLTIQAIEKAKLKAQELADWLGIKLGKIVGFNENSSVPRYFNTKAGMGAGGASPQIESGQNKIEVTVTIIYEIN